MSQQEQASEQEQQQEQSDLLQVRRDKLNELKEAGANPYEITSYDKSHNSVEIIDSFEALEEKKVSVAGRILSKRMMGKTSFAHILDDQGQVQIYVREDILGEDAFEEYKKLDIGDIVGVSGEVFKTRSGEVSVKADAVLLLSKSLLPLPEKFHGLRDTDLRYRQRYVDLIMNPEVKETFRLRSKIVKSIRDFMDDRGFIEVETPILQDKAGGATARPFVTRHNTLHMDMYLRIATELHLKRLIVGGFEKVYEMGRIFRNEGMSPRHNPEFTTIELYQAYADYEDMMELCEDMFLYCAENVLGTDTLTYEEQEIYLKAPWQRYTMLESVKKFTGIDFSTCKTDEDARTVAKEAGIELENDQMTRGEILNESFEQRVEDQLIQPTFITDYPIEVSPLAKKKADEPWLTERFELFATGRELANAFSELNDPDDQHERFLDQVRRREEGDKEANVMDEDFITALSYAMPPTGGVGIGIDRMVMLFTNSSTIREVLLFPTMRPKEGQ